MLLHLGNVDIISPIFYAWFYTSKVGSMSEPSTGDPIDNGATFCLWIYSPQNSRTLVRRKCSFWNGPFSGDMFFLIKFRLMTNVFGNHPTFASEMVLCCYFGLRSVNPPIQNREMGEPFSIRFWDHMRSWDDTNVHPDFKHIKHSLLSFSQCPPKQKIVFFIMETVDMWF